MKRRLALRTERLTALTEDELRLAGGGVADDQMTGRIDCVLSLDRCVTNMFCTVFCNIEG